MTVWAATTDAVQDRGFGGSRGGDAINGVVIHHGAGTSVLAYVAGNNNRNSHPTYHIARDGKVTGIVHPDRRPYSTAHSIDKEAVTFEIDNESAGGEWPITDASMEALIQVIMDHEAQSPRDGFAKNIRGKAQNEFFIAYHSQYVQTACPGPYITARIDWIVEECRRRRAGGAVTPPKPAPSVPAPRPTPAPAGGGTAWAFNPPSSDIQKRIQVALSKRGRYIGKQDGIWGQLSIKGIQLTIRNVGYTGPIDGIPGPNTCRFIQEYAKKFGKYTGPVDKILGPNGWLGFCRGLEAGLK